MKCVTIYSDGACLGNPGPGGWAAILEYGNSSKEFFGGELATTNNRMELEAAIQALSRLKEACEISFYTDSQYVRDGITKWINAWKARGWKKKIKNKDLWQRLDAAVAIHQIDWHWVRGHAGNRGNERCDALATQEAARIFAGATPALLSEALMNFEKTRSDLTDHLELL